jgi:hypothetical protein
MLSIPIIAEYDGKALDRAITQFKQLETVGAKTQFAIKKAAVPAAAALAGIAAAIGPAIAAASDLEENMSKVNVIFGDGAADIEAFAKTAAKSLGQSKAAVLTAAGTFGTFGKAAGLGGKDLATFSNDFTALASDLASFNNTTPEEAVNAIGAALRGEAEPMRKFGVLLNDATLKAEAMSLGIYDGSGALTDQQKILAAQSAIFKQTGDAQGDFAKTSEGLANSSRIMAAQMENLKGSIGEALLPVVQAILPYVQKFADWATKNPEAFLFIAGAIGLVAAAIVATNVAMALNPFSLIAIGVALLVAGLVVAYKKFEWFSTGVNAVVNGIIIVFETFANSWIKVINAVIRGYNALPLLPDIGLISEIKLGRVGGGDAPNAGGGINIPKMAAGGIVNQPTLAMIGEAGPEAVIPLSRMGQMGGNYTINVQGGISSSADIGEAVVNAIRAYNRAAGPANIAVA